MKNKKQFIIPLVLLTLLSSTLFWSFKEGDDFKIAKSLDIFYSLFIESMVRIISYMIKINITNKVSYFDLSRVAHCGFQI